MAKLTKMRWVAAEINGEDNPFRGLEVAILKRWPGLSPGGFDVAVEVLETVEVLAERLRLNDADVREMIGESHEAFDLPARGLIVEAASADLQAA
mgnify:CR=1 FL=1